MTTVQKRTKRDQITRVENSMRVECNPLVILLDNIVVVNERF